MDDLAFAADDSIMLALDDYRLLRLVARGHGAFVKLPLRYKFDHSAPDKLSMWGLIQRGESGWPGVPGYRITDAGLEVLKAGLLQTRVTPAV
jgi:hypothetical protein